MNANLELSREEMQALGYRVVDLLVEHLSSLRDRPVGTKGMPAVLRPKLKEPIPEDPQSVDGVFHQLEQDVFHHTMKLNHPRFFAFVPGPGNFVSVMAEALSAGFNTFSGSWLGGSAAAAVELTTIDWIRQLCGFPATAGGLFVSGGSMANLTALAVARRVRLDDRVDGATIYFSDQTHSSIERGLRVIGFRSDQFRKIPAGRDRRLPMDALREAVTADRAAGHRPFCVVANAGTTNTGAIDPLPDLLEFTRSNGLWFHVDGAYGAAAVLCDRGRDLLTGIAEADSLSIDPHKWLFQSLECGCLLVRDVAQLKDTFRMMPEYLKDIHRNEAEVNFCDLGIQLTRSFRALKMWMSLKVFGVSAFRAAIERGFELAEYTQSRLEKMPGWQIVSPARMGIVCFSYGEDSALQRAVMEAMMADGFALLTSTVLDGRTVQRMCTINPRTTEADIDETLNRLNRFAIALSRR